MNRNGVRLTILQYFQTRSCGMLSLSWHHFLTPSYPLWLWLIVSKVKSRPIDKIVKSVWWLAASVLIVEDNKTEKRTYVYAPGHMVGWCFFQWVMIQVSESYCSRSLQSSCPLFQNRMPLHTQHIFLCMTGKHWLCLWAHSSITSDVISLLISSYQQLVTQSFSDSVCELPKGLPMPSSFAGLQSLVQSTHKSLLSICYWSSKPSKLLFTFQNHLKPEKESLKHLKLILLKLILLYVALLTASIFLYHYSNKKSRIVIHLQESGKCWFYYFYLLPIFLL